MHPAQRGPRPQQALGLARWVVHLAILALLLKAAVPLLASTAARLQGVAVAQVCEVYGVALLPATASRPHADPAGHAAHESHALHAKAADPASKPRGSEAGAHHGEHCALGALAALAPPSFDAVAFSAAVPWQDAAPWPVAAGALLQDACARWVARLKHGPPLQA